MSRPHTWTAPDRVQHADIVKAAVYLATAVGEARKEGRRAVPLNLPVAERLADVLLEVASRNPEQWR